MDPISSIDDILKLGQVPLGALTLWILYQIMTTLKQAITKMDTVLDLLVKMAATKP